MKKLIILIITSISFGCNKIPQPDINYNKLMNHSWTSTKIELSIDSLNYQEYSDYFPSVYLQFTNMANTYNGGLFLESEIINNHLYKIDDKWSVSNDILNLGKAGIYTIKFNNQNSSFTATSITRLPIPLTTTSYYWRITYQ